MPQNNAAFDNSSFEFVAEVDARGRITIPRAVLRVANLSPKAFVRVRIAEVVQG